MAQVEYSTPIQDPQVFARCFRRAHFATRVLEDLFRQSVTNVTASSTGLFEYERVDGDTGYTTHISDVQFGGLAGNAATILIQKDFTEVSHLTARQVDCNFHPDTTNEPVYIITFVDKLPTLPHAGPVLKFTMQDIVAHKLCDLRWEYFVCCSRADEIQQSFLRTLCHLIRGDEVTNDDAMIIRDTAWGVAAEMTAEREEEARRYQESYGMPPAGTDGADDTQPSAVVNDGENVEEYPEEMLAPAEEAPHQGAKSAPEEVPKEQDAESEDAASPDKGTDSSPAGEV